MSEFMNECVNDLLEAAYVEGTKTALLQVGYEEKIATEYAEMMVKQGAGAQTKAVKDKIIDKVFREKPRGGAKTWAESVGRGSAAERAFMKKKSSLIADDVFTKIALPEEAAGDKGKDKKKDKGKDKGKGKGGGGRSRALNPSGEGGVTKWISKNKVPLGVGAAGLAAGAIGAELLNKKSSLIANYVMDKIAFGGAGIGKLPANMAERALMGRATRVAGSVRNTEQLLPEVSDLLKNRRVISNLSPETKSMIEGQLKNAPLPEEIRNLTVDELTHPDMLNTLRQELPNAVAGIRAAKGRPELKMFDKLISKANKVVRQDPNAAVRSALADTGQGNIPASQIPAGSFPASRKKPTLSKAAPSGGAATKPKTETKPKSESKTKKEKKKGTAKGGKGGFSSWVSEHKVPLAVGGGALGVGALAASAGRSKEGSLIADYVLNKISK